VECINWPSHSSGGCLGVSGGVSGSVWRCQGSVKESVGVSVWGCLVVYKMQKSEGPPPKKLLFVKIPVAKPFEKTPVMEQLFPRVCHVIKSRRTEGTFLLLVNFSESI
jgi:hypothetical protein